MRIFAKIIAVLILFITVIACGDNLKPDGTASNPVAATYTVTFDSQFNNTQDETTMPSPTSITVNMGEAIGTLPSEPKMTGSGYKFGGWYTGEYGTGAKVAPSTQFTGNRIVYAYWYKYKVTYQSDSTTVLAITMITTPTVEALPTPPTKTDNTFAGWWTAENGGGTQFFANTQVTKDTIVYAKWVINTTTVYAVTYNSNGGTVVGAQYVIRPAVNVGALPAVNPTRLSCKFNNWNKNSDGSGDVFTESTTVDANLTVYAQWTPNPEYIVTYNSGWGSTVEAQHVISPATNVGALPTDPTKRCYTFKEWNTKSDGTGDKFTETTDVTKDTPVYAQWAEAFTSPTGPFAIGDPGPSCVGKVFYITNGGLNGLEMAPPGWSDAYAENGDPSAVWIYGGTTDDGNGGTYQKTQTTLNGNTSTDIGKGLTNSEAIKTQVAGVGDTTTPYAAKLCRDYHGGGKYDWFLPSKDELTQLYAQKDAKRWGGFVRERYWSSSEYDTNDGWSQYFTTGAQQGTYKSIGLLVRPVRAF